MVELNEGEVAALARAATGSDLAVSKWELVPTGLTVHNMTTSRIDRLCGTMADGSPWSVFVKTLHPASSSPMWEAVPEAFHEQVLAELNWLDEPRVYRSGLSDLLPDGLRMPIIHRIDEQPGTITLWMEDVPDSPIWDLARYQRSARCLGRLAGRWPGASSEALGLQAHPVDGLFFGKICNHDLAVMGADDFWADPMVASVVDDDHRADLFRLASAVPELLGRLKGLPHGLSHGDAAPDNLREPGDGTIAAIDWSYASIAPVGSDLGQLVAGRVGAEQRSREDTESLVDAAVDAFMAGLADEGSDVDRASVAEACTTHLAVHFVFSALLLDGPEAVGIDQQELLRRRATLGRTGMDLALSLV